MMVTEKVVFETEDGKQFPTLQSACEYEFREDIKSALEEGVVNYDGFDATEALNALLRDFNITRKEKESD